MARLLVVTSVHPSDDPRIREKLIRTLDTSFDVTYASKPPGPVEQTGLRWRSLGGGRFVRWLAALRLMLTERVDVIVFHDPELIPAGILTRLVRRIPIVFDLHENVPAQMLTKTSVPRLLRFPLLLAARFWLACADRTLDVTLAEDGYQALFRSPRPVFPNYPEADGFPEYDTGSRAGIVYVGDVTEQRGAMTLLDAAAAAGDTEIVYVGRCSDVLRRRLLDRAAGLGVDIEILGWRPHEEAMAIAGRARVGVSPLHDVPNYRHSLPTKTLEYLALGTPVIASDLPGTRAVIGSLPGVRLVSPGSVAALTEALAAVDDDLVKSAISGAEAVRQRFRWPSAAVIDYYVSLVED
jgi:glycosyltransferase involved in cell wall biosynthesis